MPSEVRVLVVDDNPMVLSLLRQALAPLASVHAAGNPADALLLALDEPPDLIVTDYGMPGMDGRQLVEKLRLRPGFARMPVVLMASKAEVSDRLKPMQDSLEDILEKPFFVRDAVARIKRVIDKIALEKMAQAAPSGTTLRGTLAQMSVIDLLQSLEMGRKSCLLTLTRRGDKCELFFDEGQISHAVFAELQGDEAVYRVVQWSGEEGTFEIDFARRSDMRTITRSTQGLLMEGLRLLDESNRDSEFA